MQSAAETAALIQVKTFLSFEDYFFFAITALFCYDYCLTLGREIKYMWARKQSFATLIFYAYRYPALLNTIIELLERVPWGWQSEQSCAVVERTQMVLDLMILISATVFSALRVFAIFGRNNQLFIAVLLTGLVNPAISVWIFVKSQPAFDEYHGSFQAFQGCTLAIKGDRPEYETFMMIARGASLFSDGLVLLLTCLKTRRGPVIDIRETVRGILLKDTAVCFAFLCVVNVIGIATGRLTQFIDIWTTWTAILTSLLLSRLALDLRGLYDAESTETDLPTFTTLQLTRFDYDKEVGLEPTYLSSNTGESS